MQTAHACPAHWPGFAHPRSSQLISCRKSLKVRSAAAACGGPWYGADGFADSSLKALTSRFGSFPAWSTHGRSAEQQNLSKRALSEPRGSARTPSWNPLRQLGGLEGPLHSQRMPGQHRDLNRWSALPACCHTRSGHSRTILRGQEGIAVHAGSAWHVKPDQGGRQ